MLKKFISLTVIFSMLSIDLVRAMEPDDLEKKHLFKRLSAAIVANDKDEEPLEQETLQEPLLDKSSSKVEEQESAEYLKGLNSLKSILLTDFDGEGQGTNHKNGEDPLSPESQMYLSLEEREFPDLTQAKARLEKIEGRSSFLKWGYWDSVFNKMSYAVWLRQNDMTSMPAKGCCPGASSVG